MDAARCGMWMLLMLVGSASADEGVRLRAGTLPAFSVEAEQVRRGLLSGERYEFVLAEEREQIRVALSRIEQLLAAGEPLTASAATEVDAARSRVNAILARRDGEQRVCERRRGTGSNIAATRCTTYAQRERERRESERFLRESRRDSATTPSRRPQVR